ncbi:hypothetical protein [Candidatus Nitrosocosmicus franklandus]|uniref:Uncharacterized protein n=1 Tax=Candidatus Nitrosocosmicus franklandianus TaxID=1798806 RepID=A0A484IBK1_9ARCH|nr:hypothetical protein [Candidatus Nitrosocosmicus franklandus]VFJ14458.1 protein of unknown function [Candidatus Nitrosocosmicus franklandus]
MYKSNKNLNSKEIKILAGLLLGFSMVTMIPLSEMVMAKPVFDGTTLGQGCSNTYDKIMNLRAKKANGSLTQSEASELGNAESSYNQICAGIYGPLPPRTANTNGWENTNNGGIYVEDKSQSNPNVWQPTNNGGIYVEDKSQSTNSPETEGEPRTDESGSQTPDDPQSEDTESEQDNCVELKGLFTKHFEKVCD